MSYMAGSVTALRMGCFLALLPEEEHSFFRR